MDDFGVLVQSYGIKPQGKSAPMASIKSSTRNHNAHLRNSSKPTTNYASDSYAWNDEEDPFSFNYEHKPKSNGSFDVFDDAFNLAKNNSRNGVGMEFDIETMFKDSTKLNSDSSKNRDVSGDDYGDLLGGFSGSKSTGIVDDLLSSTPKSSDPVDDLFGNFEKVESSKGASVGKNTRNGVDTDDLVPGIGRSTTKGDSMNATFSPSGGVKDDVDLLGAFSKPAPPFRTRSEAEQKPSYRDFLDMTDERTLSNNQSHDGVDLDSFFSAHVRRKSAPSKPSKATTDTKNSDAVPDLFGGMSSRVEKNISPISIADDLFSGFGAASLSLEFVEIDGESEDRRRARWERYKSTKTRMEQALADMNQREFQAQQEQEEKQRISETMDLKMKRWAAGKEGNLRALLSSLQQVLWPECGWKPVSLTDLITYSQVKLVYKKATLCVHPDKVQAKGANSEQKYVAEKVFDLLKEAWNKFSKEELR